MQRAALIGGVFWFGGLVVLDRADREPPVLWNEEDDESRLDITDRLQRLMERDYVMRLPDSTFPGDEEYVFRHRQERERISALTSPADARKWHRLLADWLDSKPEIRTHEQYLEMLAEQREKSGIADWAARAYLEAAGRARAHSAWKRELLYCEKALSLLGEHDYGRRLDALLRTGELLEWLDRAEDALERYRTALVLAFRLDRRAAWVAARLAATRLLAKLGLSDESMTHLESQIPPEPEVTIDVVDSSSTPGSVAEVAAPVPSAPISSSQPTWPEPLAAPAAAMTIVAEIAALPAVAAELLTTSPVAEASPSSVAPATVPSSPEADPGAVADAAPVTSSYADPANSPVPEARAVQSSTPSDPGAEPGTLALVPEPGIGMAAAGAEGDPRTTESAT
jgi:hypothetical protein